MTLKREACSSREAVYYTLKNMLKNMKTINAHSRTSAISSSKVEAITQNSKAEKALELIKEINDKVIIFTEYRATQLYLQWYLKQHGIHLSHSEVALNVEKKTGCENCLKTMPKF